MEGFCVEHAWSWNETKLIIMTSGISLGEFVLIARVVFSFPLSGPASHHQFSIEENETSYSGKVHHHHRRHTHSQDTLCHTHTKNSEYSQPEEELSKQCLSANPWHTSRLRHWCPFHVRRCMLISSSKSHTQILHRGKDGFTTVNVLENVFRCLFQTSMRLQSRELDKWGRYL